MFRRNLGGQEYALPLSLHSLSNDLFRMPSCVHLSCVDKPHLQLQTKLQCSDLIVFSTEVPAAEPSNSPSPQAKHGYVDPSLSKLLEVHLQHPTLFEHLQLVFVHGFLFAFDPQHFPARISPQ